MSLIYNVLQMVSSKTVPVVGTFTIADHYTGDLDFALTPPTSTSPGAWTYTSSNSSIAQVIGGSLRSLAVGSCTITATQAPSGIYAQGGPVTTSFNVLALPLSVWTSNGINPGGSGGVIVAGKGRIYSAGCGSVNDAMWTGGNCGVYGASGDAPDTSYWNGSSFLARGNAVGQLVGGASTAKGGTGNALLAGGSANGVVLDKVWLYNGSAWVSKPVLGSGGYSPMMAGNGSAALFVATTKTMRKWNGTAWSAGVNAIVIRTNGSGCGGGGTTTSALIWGGMVTGVQSAACEAFNGTSWTSVANLNIAVRLQCGTASSTLDALSCGGTAPLSVATEQYNGTVWTIMNSMTKTRSQHAGGSGASTSAIVCYNNNTTDATSEIYRV